MEILEDKARWSANFQSGWLAELEQNGVIDWKLYQHPRNEETPGAPGVALGKSRLMLISSAGGYLRDRQRPFDAASHYGDYTLRTYPSTTPPGALAYAHDHYDHTMIDQDSQVALPVVHLHKMVADGRIGSLTPSVISFMGYQPDLARVVDDLIPPIVAIARAEGVQAALLAPV